ncbi:uncharacterized protein TRIADDRAFT_55509 [Trichoplax adhaerens]|uniref:Fanconi anaemia group A protein N-terminal domain-containing protein n=1 Tax=Trichoplax adhaerens TaxID=10228 RepID=B3RV33_TRIAD|nr:predicted protein [Trichoplax adhaerens]EDV25926.1 predicted protein [Trichoplax adhaerens]|eukprot:XP_002111959.1 predicted protein [Trichoplax adhaerens]
MATIRDNSYTRTLPANTTYCYAFSVGEDVYNCIRRAHNCNKNTTKTASHDAIVMINLLQGRRAEVWAKKYKIQDGTNCSTLPIYFATAINQKIIELFPTNANIPVKYYLNFLMPTEKRAALSELLQSAALLYSKNMLDRDYFIGQFLSRDHNISVEIMWKLCHLNLATFDDLLNRQRRNFTKHLAGSIISNYQEQPEDVTVAHISNVISYIMSDVLSYLENSSVAEDETHKRLREFMDYFIENYIEHFRLNYEKMKNKQCNINNLDLMNLLKSLKSIKSTPTIEQIFTTQIMKLLKCCNDAVLKDLEILSLQNRWHRKGSLQSYYVLFTELLNFVDAKKLRETVFNVLSQREKVDWSSTLALLSILCIKYENTTNMLYGLIDTMFEDALRNCYHDLILTVIILVRQCSLLKLPKFYPYTEWIQAHIIGQPSVPANCQDLLVEYIALAKANLAKLKEQDLTNEKEQATNLLDEVLHDDEIFEDVKKAVMTFKRTNEIPSCILEASGNKIPATLWNAFEERRNKPTKLPDHGNSQSHVLARLWKCVSEIRELSQRSQANERPDCKFLLDEISKIFNEILPLLSTKNDNKNELSPANKLNEGELAIVKEFHKSLLALYCKVFQLLTSNKDTDFMGNCKDWYMGFVNVLHSFPYILAYVVSETVAYLSFKDHNSSDCSPNGIASLLLGFLTSKQQWRWFLISDSARFCTNGLVLVSDYRKLIIDHECRAILRSQLKLALYLSIRLESILSLGMGNEDMKADLGSFTAFLNSEQGKIILEEEKNKIAICITCTLSLMIDRLVLSEWINYELNICQDHDFFRNEAERLTYWNWIFRKHFLTSSIVSGGCGGQYRYVCEMLIKSIKDYMEWHDNQNIDPALAFMQCILAEANQQQGSNTKDDIILLNILKDRRNIMMLTQRETHMLRLGGMNDIQIELDCIIKIFARISPNVILSITTGKEQTLDSKMETFKNFINDILVEYQITGFSFSMELCSALLKIIAHYGDDLARYLISTSPILIGSLLDHWEKLNIISGFFGNALSDYINEFNTLQAWSYRAVIDHDFGADIPDRPSWQLAIMIFKQIIDKRIVEFLNYLKNYQASITLIEEVSDMIELHRSTINVAKAIVASNSRSLLGLVNDIKFCPIAGREYFRVVNLLREARKNMNYSRLYPVVYFNIFGDTISDDKDKICTDLHFINETKKWLKSLIKLSSLDMLEKYHDMVKLLRDQELKDFINEYRLSVQESSAFMAS